MTRIAPKSGEPLDATPRRAMTPKRRAAVLARHAGHCAYPGCTVSTGLEIDHVIALELGGKDADENLVPLCGPHHKQKTALDAKLIAKARRLRKTEAGETRAKRPIPSRGFAPGKRAIPSRPFPRRQTP